MPSPRRDRVALADDPQGRRSAPLRRPPSSVTRSTCLPHGLLSRRSTAYGPNPPPEPGRRPPPSQASDLRPRAVASPAPGSRRHPVRRLPPDCSAGRLLRLPPSPGPRSRGRPPLHPGRGAAGPRRGAARAPTRGPALRRGQHGPLPDPPPVAWPRRSTAVRPRAGCRDPEHLRHPTGSSLARRPACHPALRAFPTRGRTRPTPRRRLPRRCLAPPLPGAPSPPAFAGLAWVRAVSPGVGRGASLFLRHVDPFGVGERCPSVRTTKTPRPLQLRARRGRFEKSRRRPTLPGSFPPSTIGAGGLHFRVRDGNGCFPAALPPET